MISIQSYFQRKEQPSTRSNADLWHRDATDDLRSDDIFKAAFKQRPTTEAPETTQAVCCQGGGRHDDRHHIPADPHRIYREGT